jgi:hypothetical protein
LFRHARRSPNHQERLRLFGSARQRQQDSRLMQKLAGNQVHWKPLPPVDMSVALAWQCRRQLSQNVHDMLDDKILASRAPARWDEIRSWVAHYHSSSDPQRLYNFYRHPDMVVKYAEHKKNVLKQYGSMRDFIAHRYFGLQPRLNNDRKLQVNMESMPEKKVVMCANDYPYCLEEGVQHDVIWSSYALNAEEIRHHIANHLPDRDFVWFVNPVANQSVPGLWHAHVMSRKIKPSGAAKQ